MTNKRELQNVRFICYYVCCYKAVVAVRFVLKCTLQEGRNNYIFCVFMCVEQEIGARIACLRVYWLLTKTKRTRCTTGD